MGIVYGGGGGGSGVIPPRKPTIEEERVPRVLARPGSSKSIKDKEEVAMMQQVTSSVSATPAGMARPPNPPSIYIYIYIYILDSKKNRGQYMGGGGSKPNTKRPPVSGPSSKYY